MTLIGATREIFGFFARLGPPWKAVGGAALALERIGILRLARDLPALRHLLRRQAHAVGDAVVDHLGLAAHLVSELLSVLLLHLLEECGASVGRLDVTSGTEFSHLVYLLVV